MGSKNKLSLKYKAPKGFKKKKQKSKRKRMKKTKKIGAYGL